MKHLLIITPSFPKSTDNEIVVPPLHLFLRTIQASNPDIVINIIALHYPFTTETYPLFNCTVHPFNAQNGSIINRPKIWAKALRRMSKIHSDLKIDLVHSFWINETALLGNLFSGKKRIPHLVTMMGQDALPSNKYLKLINLKKLELVALSDFQKEQFTKLYPNKNIEVIPWGMHKKDIQKETNTTRPIDILIVSSLIPLKRVHLFIELVAQLKASFKNLNAVIIGEGKLRTELEQLVDSKQVRNQITFKGLQSREDVLATMRQSKILIHTSEYEAQGYVLNEALSSGCYVHTLSKGLLISSEKYTIYECLDDLSSATKERLINNLNDYGNYTPITMERTVKEYDQLLSHFRLSYFIKQ